MLPGHAPWSEHRVSSALNLAWFGPHRMASNRRLAFTALLRPCTTISELFCQARRQKINGQVAADVVLVELTRGVPANQRA